MFRFDRTVNMGAVLQIGTVVVGIVFMVATLRNDAEQTKRDVESLRVSMSDAVRGMRETQTQSITAMRADVSSALGRLEGSVSALQGQISSLPDLGARLTQAERRLEAYDTRWSGLEGNINRIRDSLVETRADVNAMARGIGAAPSRDPNGASPTRPAR